MSVMELKERHRAMTETVNSLRKRLKQRRVQLLDPCALWDISTGLKASVFGEEFQSGHTTDVLSASISGSNSRMFVSGSCDSTARLWDTRVAIRAVRTFHGHEGDVNKVKFFLDGNRFKLSL